MAANECEMADFFLAGDIFFASVKLVAGNSPELNKSLAEVGDIDPSKYLLNSVLLFLLL